MNIIEVLHSYWVGERHDVQKVRDSWRKVDTLVNDNFPESKKDDFLCLLNEHCYKVEYQGFLAGFRMATAIWKKMK